MDELVKQVMDRTHISQDQAQGAVQTVLTFLKGKLPPQMAGQVDAVLSGNAPDLGQASKDIGGLFGH